MGCRSRRLSSHSGAGSDTPCLCIRRKEGMKQKRLAAFLLAILMLVFTFPVQAAGADEDEPVYEYDEVEADLEEDGGGDGPDAELTASAGGARFTG